MPHPTASTDVKIVHNVLPNNNEAFQDEFFKFSTNDYLPQPAIWVPVLLHFAIPDGEQKAVAEKLRAGLAATLPQCRHLTGTIEIAENGDHGILSHKDSTVQFVEHWCDSSEVPSYEELAASDFATSKLGDLKRWSLKGMEFNPVDSAAATDRSPAVLGVQANFIPGGIAMAVHAHHWVMDFAGLAGFLYLWADTTRALAEGTPLPSLDPMCLYRARLESTLTASTEEVVPEDSSTQDKELNGNGHTKPSAPGGLPKFLPVSICLFHLPKSKAAALKDLATSESGPWISSYDACAALWFRILTRYRAQAYQPDESAPAPFSQLVNIRSKLSPPLPALYFGNAIVPVGSDSQFVQLTIKEVAQTASLATIAVYIRRLTNSVDSAYIWKTLDAIKQSQQSGAAPKRKTGAIPPLKTTDWRGPNVYQADFGFAKPTALRHLLGVAPSVTIYPYRQARADQEEVLEFAVPVETTVLEKMLQDEDVQKWFEFRGFDYKA